MGRGCWRNVFSAPLSQINFLEGTNGMQNLKFSLQIQTDRVLNIDKKKEIQKFQSGSAGETYVWGDTRAIPSAYCTSMYYFNFSIFFFKFL